MVKQPTVQDAMMTALRLHQSGKLADAEFIYRQVLAQNPNHPDALNLLGMVGHQAGQHEPARQLVARAVELEPATADFRYNLGLILASLRRWEEAIASYRQAIALRPDDADSHNNLGVALYQSGELSAAVESYRRALALRPIYAQAFHNLSTVFGVRGQFEEAMAASLRAVEIEPDFAEGRLGLGLLRLAAGDFAGGWPEYEWRWKAKDCGLTPIKSGEPYWDGSELHGKRILIHAEQAFGDAIQFARYIPLVARRGGKVIFSCHRELLALLGTVQGVEEVADKDASPPRFDVHCPLLSLPRIFGTTLENIPAKVPYIFADARRVEQWRARLTEYGSALKIGIVWAGRKLPDAGRSAPLDIVSSLALVHNVQLISLQTGEAAEQAVDSPAGIHIARWTEHIKDFADTAALIAHLDVVVTIDTATAHLAGAMGKPTWVLLKSLADWRWMRGRDDSPWYPAMRLFRQPAPGDWRTPISQIAQSLKTFRDT